MLLDFFTAKCLNLTMKNILTGGLLFFNVDRVTNA